MKILFRAALAAAISSALVAPQIFAQAPGAGATNTPPPLPVPVLPAESNAAPATTATKPAAGGAKTNATTAAAAKKKTPAKAAPKTTAKKEPKKAEPRALEAKSEPLLGPEPGVARQDNVNVRGQATLGSEVVARLKKGDQVTVLQEITKSAKQDEPSRWYKIALPTNVSVWVHSSFVDTNAGTVKARRLNLRGGPGENYSVIGRLEKGAPIKAIGSKGEWIKIEPSTNSFAYVAAHLIQRTPGAAIAATAPPPATTKAPEPAVTTPPPAVVTPVPPPTVPPTTVTEVPPVPATAAPAPITPAVTPAPAETATAPKPAVPAPAETVPGETNAAPIETVRKVVSREGLLKGSVSIQAPTYFELRSLDTGKAIDYVFSPSTNLVLKQFKGQRVIVTGEEVLDERWQHTPVLVIETLQTVP